MAGEMDAGLDRVAEAWQLGAPYLVEELGIAYPEMLISQGREEEALTVLRQARQLQPDNLEIIKLAGVALFRTGRYQQGRSVFESLIQRVPGSPEPFFSYAAALASLGQHDAAVDIAKRGLEKFPQDPGLNNVVQRGGR